MAAVRRSTRLSSVGVRNTTFSSTPPVAKGTRRSVQVWRHREVDESNSNAESDDDAVTAKGFKEKSRQWMGESTDDEENIENCNVINKIMRNRNKKNNAMSKVNTAIAEEPAATPKSKKNKANRPMPASKKREILNKRKATIAVTTAESSDDGSCTAEEEEKGQVSPPKQPRQQRPTNLTHQLISPSRLIDRLSIDERGECTASDSSEHEKPETHNREHQHVAPQKSSPNSSSKARNKYQNARRVLNSAETENLPGREQQLKELSDFFTEHLNEQKSGSLYVSGQPGTGKTACLSLLLQSPEFAHRLQRVYINCTSIASIGGIYKKLCTELNLHPSGRAERDYLAAIQKHICCTKRMLLLVLDEIDQLCSSRQSVLYTIFEWPSLPKAKVLLVGIANSLDLTDRSLMRLNARCELKPKLMHFPPYTKQQIVDIFRSRLEVAGVLDVFPPVTLQLLAAKVSAVSGDVRRALDIGRRVVEIAEQQKKTGKHELNLKDLNIDNATEEEALEPVKITQVAEVLKNVYGASQNLQEDIEESFPLQQKIMLCSLMLMLRNEKNKDINIGRLHEVYRRICKKRNIHSVDQAEFAGLVDLVETRGILRIIRKKEPRLSKVVLQWDEEEVNAALCDKQLIASILDDTSCLSKC